MEPLTPAEIALVYRRAIAMWSARGLATDPTVIAREIYNDMRGDALYIQVYQTVVQAQRGVTSGNNVVPGANIPGPGAPTPVDPSIPAGGGPYRARVLVTVHLPDGTSATTNVVIDFAGPQTEASLIALAIAQVQMIAGAQLPPPPFGAPIAYATYSGEIYTIGRERGV